MRWIQRLRMAMLMLFRRSSETARLDQEMQFHLDQQIAENIAAGMAPDQARSAALRTFGNPTLLHDQARSTWSWSWLEKFTRDVRYGARTLVRSPGFAIVAVLVMALGIGATTSLFTIVRAVLLKPLPFHDPNNLVMVYEHFHDNQLGDGFNVVAPGDFRDWRAHTNGYQDMAAWREYGFNLAGEHAELPEVVKAAGGSWNLFPLLGIQMAHGRSFTPEEDQVGANHVVLLTWNIFQRRFAGDASIVGKQVRLDSNPYTVIGVLPASFTYPDSKTQVWVPYAQTLTARQYDAHDNHQSLVIARLKPGVTATSALAQVSALQYQLHLANASKPVAESAVSRPMIDDVVLDIKTPLTVLFCAVGCMLLIACLNVSNLFVARSAARRKEIAVRGALGGTRLTLIRELMTESLLICTAGGVLGLAISALTTHWLATHWDALPRAEVVRMDVPVLAFSMGLVVLTALLAGLLPAISATGKMAFGVLQESSRSIGGSTSRATIRKTLLAVEIALTVILLFSAGLLFKSFMHLRTTDLGCVTDRVLTIKYGLPENQYNTREKVVAFHESLLEKVRRLPGVISAALVSTPPGGGYEGDDVFTIPEHPPAASVLQDDAIYRSADPEYFKVMQIPLLSGRVFTNQERLTRDHYIVISKKLADQYFSGDNPIGRHIRVSWDVPEPENYEIIGVVGDTVYDVAEPIKPTMYFPVLSGLPNQVSSSTIMVRTPGDPLLLSVPVQKQVAALDPSLPVYDVLTMQQILGKTTASQSFSATLTLAFALLSLLLAAIGLYGVLSYLISQRITEIGIRIALGAQRSQVLRLILLDGLRPVFLGLLIGLAGGAVVGTLIRSILFGTSPYDPVVFAAMIGSLLLTAVAACAIPALRALKIDPMQALRTE
ncbi:ABC transporter permease [Tunturiibacter gelidoferens]|uniref:Putative permease n=1 Tax=Tunturiibacter lichenicola TaxID=2051959 RepID=A0A7Y9NQB2_9BACT|nr:ABC transporter permease [Edaphobacter lichenicola]NYF52955.1 putative permease [Edaphobacter lichenicola]